MDISSSGWNVVDTTIIADEMIKPTCSLVLATKNKLLATMVVFRLLFTKT